MNSAASTTGPGANGQALLASTVTCLNDFEPPNATQAGLRDEYLAHLADHGADGLFKSGPPEHVTASCFVFDRDLTSTLLTLHAKAKAWMQFGGHLEVSDLSLADAAIREGREESGLPDLKLLSPLPLGWLDRHALHGKFTCSEHLDIAFVALTDGMPAPVISVESDDVAWFDLKTLTKLAGSVDGIAASAEPTPSAARIMPDVPHRLARIVSFLHNNRG